MRGEVHGDVINDIFHGEAHGDVINDIFLPPWSVVDTAFMLHKYSDMVTQYTHANQLETIS